MLPILYIVCWLRDIFLYYYPPPKAEGYCFGVRPFRPSVRPSVRHFCVRSHILEVLWRISLKLGMSIYMDKRMMHAKWHCTPSINNGVMALVYILKKCFSLWQSSKLAGDINSTNFLVWFILLFQFENMPGVKIFYWRSCLCIDFHHN